jgi:hypothetical protein
MSQHARGELECTVVSDAAALTSRDYRECDPGAAERTANGFTTDASETGDAQLRLWAFKEKVRRARALRRLKVMAERNRCLGARGSHSSPR